MRLLPLELQRHPLQQIDHRIQGGMLVIGRTLARCQPRLGLGSHVCRQHLDETRFADARFAAEQHHLPEAVLDLRPALQEQPYFLLPAHERGQAGAAGRFQATAGHTLIQHLIDLQRLGDAFQQRGAYGLAGKEAAKELKGRGTDHQGIGRREPLQAGGDVRRLAQRQLLLSGATSHVSPPPRARYGCPGARPAAPLAPAPGGY